jgi:hypothetical protein
MGILRLRVLLLRLLLLLLLLRLLLLLLLLLQPSTVASIWNFRGLEGNAWHYVDLAVTASR